MVIKIANLWREIGVCPFGYPCLQIVIVGRFSTDGGKDAMRLMEQYVMDALELEGVDTVNQRRAINKERGRLRNQYKGFLDKVCK